MERRSPARTVSEVRPGEMIMVARGEQGRIWRLDTDTGRLRGQAAGRSSDAPPMRLLMSPIRKPCSRRGRVCMPRPIRAADGQVLVEVAEHQVRVYEWVDVLSMDPNLDPGVIGETLAAIHQVHYAPARPLIGWYTEPVGASRWTELLRGFEGGRCSFCRGSRRGDQRAAAPGSLDRAAHESPKLSSRPVGRQHPADTDRRGLRDRLGELRIGGSSAGTTDGHDRLCVSVIIAGASSCTRHTWRPADLRGSAAIGSFTMVIAQFGHFWEAAITAYLATDALEDRAHNLDRIAELLNPPLRVVQLEEMLDAVASIR